MSAGPLAPVKRLVEGHPGPDVPKTMSLKDTVTGEWFRESQFYACERPEDSSLRGILWHSDCQACMVALQAALANSRGVILMTHGRTRRNADGSFFR